VTTANDPTTLVDALLAALARGSAHDVADAAWPLLAPRMRSQLGDVGGLARVLSNTLFAPLLSGAEVTVANLERREGAARALLRVRSQSDPTESVPYLLSMSRSRGGDEPGRWRLTGLARDDLPG
jgi:hypothetical protein